MVDQQVGPGLYVKLGLDYQGMIGGIGGVSLALNQTLNLFSKFEGMAQGFINLATNAGQFGKSVKDNARDLGLSTQQFQQWRYAAIAAGSSAEEITGSIRMMSIRMKEAADPTSDMRKTLAKLGVSVLDSKGHMRSMNDVLLDILPALNALPEGFDRNQVAMALFGRSFSNIADLASLSRDELQKLINQAPVFSDEKITKLDKFNTQMQLLNEKMERSKTLAGSELIGSFTTWGTMIDNMLQKGQPLFTFFKGLNLLLEMMAEGFVLLGGSAMIAAKELYEISRGNVAWGLYEARIAYGELGTQVKQMQYDFAQGAAGLSSITGLPSGPGREKTKTGYTTTGTGSSGGGAGGTGGADTYANNQLAMQKKYSGPAVYEGVKGNWDKGVFYPDVGPPTSAKAPANWLEKIGAKYDRGEISRYALGVSKGEQNLAAEALQRQTNLSKLPLRDQPQREPQKVEVALKLEFNTPEAARLFKVILDRDSTRNRRALGYPDIT